MAKMFIASDGDDVGHHLESLIVTNQTPLIGDFFKTFQLSMKWLEEKLSNDYEAVIIFNGGDNILAEFFVTSNQITSLEKLRKDFFELSGRTLSIGIGKNPRDAFLALKLAKASGKDCLIQFDEVCNVNV
jgi:GTP cyclohydrolase III